MIKKWQVFWHLSFVLPDLEGKWMMSIYIWNQTSTRRNSWPSGGKFTLNVSLRLIWQVQTLWLLLWVRPAIQVTNLSSIFPFGCCFLVIFCKGASHKGLHCVRTKHKGGFIYFAANTLIRLSGIIKHHWIISTHISQPWHTLA